MAFNSFFANIATQVQNSLSQSKFSFNHYLSKCSDNSSNDSFYLHNINVKEVENAIDDLKYSATTDVYGLSAKLVRYLKNCLLIPLAFLFNLCIDKQCFLNSLKLAKVVPIFKKGDKNSFDNYRPISVLPQYSQKFLRQSQKSA